MKLTPVEQMAVEDITALEATVKERLLEETSRRLALPRDQLVVRDIMPKTDLGLANEEWITPTLTADAWTKYFDKALPNNRFVIFYGVANQSPTPIATGVLYKLGPTGGTTKGVMMLEELYATRIPIGITDEAILYRGGDHIYIDVWAKEAGTEALVLKGMVCEPYGEVVSG